MATVRLESYDRNVTDLPDVCMKCGAPATVRKQKSFSWYPPWVAVLLLAGLLPFIIVAIILTKRSRVEVPLCDAHKHHWMMRQLLVVLSLLGLLALGFVAMIAAGFLSERNNQGAGGDAYFGVVCMGWVVLMIGWIIMAAILQTTSIRPKEITDTSITLVSVSKEFVQAYDEEWHGSPERFDELAREHWDQGTRRPRSRDRAADDDSDRIRRPDEKGRGSPPDAYQEGTP